MDFRLDKVQGLLDKLAKLPSHYRIAMLIAIPLLLAGGYYHFVYRESAKELSQLDAQQQALQRKLHEVRSVAANLDAFEEEIQSLEAELKVALRQLPDSKELPGLLTDISTLGKKAGLEFKAFRPKGEVSRGFYAEVPIDIEFTGRYHQVATFFDRIAKLHRIVNVGDLRMGVAKEALGGTVLKVGGQATTFRFLEGGGA
jgi:type IV pilus assembly protein PilO